MRQPAARRPGTGGAATRSIRSRLLTAASAVLMGCAVVLAVSSCYVSVGALQHRTNSYSVSGAIRTLAVRGHAGNVDVTGGAVSVSVTEQIAYRHAVPQTTHRTSGGTLTLDSSCPATETCSVSYKIQVPGSLTVQVTNGAGGIKLTSLAGQVTAHTNAGNIDLAAMSGPLNITDHAGSIHGQRVSSAQATLATSVGEVDVTFSAAPATVVATASVGSVTLHVPGGVPYSVDAGTVVGSTDITVQRSASSPHFLTARTKTGSVTIAPA